MSQNNTGTKTSDKWISVEDKPMPFEQFIIVAHPHGIDAINFHTGAWRYWYINKEINEVLLRSITHWYKPQPPTKTSNQ